VPSNTAVAAVDNSYRDAAGAGGHTGGQVALEDEYQDDSYDYGDYGEGYEDSSGMIGKKHGLFFLDVLCGSALFLMPIGIRQQNNDANPQAELRILPPVDTCWKIRTFLSHFTF
jgi:hypothetical protein